VAGRGQEGDALLEVVGVLGSEVELTAGAMRRGLEKLAAALVPARPGADASQAVGTALDCAELVTRGELAQGNLKQLPYLLPSFVFLVSLPIVGQDEALALARRTESLVET
jgi:hypothetical protein